MPSRESSGLTPASRWWIVAFRSCALLLAACLVPVAALSFPHGPAVPVLPLVSLLAVAGAVLIAAAAWWTGAWRTGPDVTAWDVSGAFAFIGIAAGMMSEPDQVLLLFDAIPLKE